LNEDRPGTISWWYKVCANIRGGSLERGRQTTVWLSTTAIFGVFAGYFFGYFRDETSVIYGDTQSLVGFSVIPKCVTLNNPEWLFRVNFCFRAGLVGRDNATFQK